MFKSSDPANFFQTTSSIEESDRKTAKSQNVFGNPIKLPSKLTAVIPDPINEDGIYVAESAGTVKRVSLSTNEVTHTFVGPAAPVNCITILGERVDGSIKQTLFAGCWDKQIWAWEIPNGTNSSSTIKSSQRFQGHTDFVKAVAVLALPGLSAPLLVSGGAESEILFWDIKTGKRLHVLKGHVRGILDLKFDPSTIFPGTEAAVLYSASSDREIRTCTIPIPPSGESISTSTLKTLQLSPPLLVHETSVYSLFFSEDGTDLWTASADKSAKHLARTESDDPNAKSEDPSNLTSLWTPDTTLLHPDFVRSIVAHPTIPLAITACRDEEVRLWNSSTGALVHTYSGHFDEVTGLCIRGSEVISVSIDCTIRRWGLGGEDIEKYKQEVEKANAGKEEEEASGAGAGQSMLTEEEERELAELMAEDD